MAEAAAAGAAAGAGSEADGRAAEDVELTCPICLASSDDVDASATDEDASNHTQEQAIGGSAEAATSTASASAATEAEGVAEFLKTPCGHIFCQICIERVLLQPRRDGIPTRAPCPMCRESVSLFDLRRARRRAKNDRDWSSSVYAGSSDVKTWPVANSQYKQRSLIAMPNANAVLESMIEDKGAIEGFGIKFIFEESAPPSLEFAKPLRMTFDCDWTKIIGRGAESVDGEGIMAVDSVMFDDAHFHEKSTTFHGRVSFANPVSHNSYCYDRMSCSLNFSDGCRYVRRGILDWKLAPTPALTYPLDGAWEVQYGDGRLTMRIFVQNHFFTVDGDEYNIDIGVDRCPHFMWPGRFHWVCQHSEYKLMPGSSGPRVGESLVWRTNAQGYERIVWKRLEQNLDNAWQAVHLKAGDFVYQKCNQQVGDGQPLGPSYHKNTVWGNTFCQLFAVGMASYHFVEEPDVDGVFQAYISYESPRTEVWPTLDNGENVPARVPFRNVQYDEDTRTFRGDICWEEDYNTTWMSESKWQYEIVFDETFMFVSSGTVRQSMGEPHRFGFDLIYLNAALEIPLREIRETAQSTGAFLDVLRKWRDDGEASPGTLEMMGEVAMNVLADRESVFDFNL